MYRSHNCGELNASHINQEVTLAGWVQKSRDKGFMNWVDLRDRYGITQLIFDESRTDKTVFELAKTLGREFVIQVKGTVIEREAKNNNIPTFDTKQWNIFSIQFKTKLKFNGTSGSMNITGPLLVNSISRYRVVNPTTIDTQGLQPWRTISDNGTPANALDDPSWGEGDIANDQIADDWRDYLYTTVTTSQNIDPKDLYNNFVGTNKIIIEDDTTLRFADYKYQTHNDITWQTQFLNAV